MKACLHTAKRLAFGGLWGVVALAAVSSPGGAQSSGAGPRPPVAGAAPAPDSALLARAYEQARALPRFRSLLIHWRGSVVREHYFRGATRAQPANIKSASKSVIASLVGIAIAHGQIRSVHQPIGELLPEATRDLDARKRAITVEDLLSMRSGLQSTSFENYGAWVTSRNWVRDALRRPLVAEPGGPMIYSTGSTHLLSAILTRATGMSTHRYAERMLARPLGIPLRAWTRDPQGIYFGGNEMRMTPREMVAFGVLHLNGGRARSGAQVIPKGWTDSAWVRRTRSGWSGQDYGYGWWIRRSGAHDVYFAWGYGGQFIFVVPTLDLVVVTTSDPNATNRERGHLEAIYSILDYAIVPALYGSADTSGVDSRDRSASTEGIRIGRMDQIKNGSIRERERSSRNDRELRGTAARDATDSRLPTTDSSSGVPWVFPFSSRSLREGVSRCETDPL